MTGSSIISIEENLFASIRDPPSSVETENVSVIQSSPYSETDHLLHLKGLDTGYRALAIALQAFQPQNSNFAFDSYTDAFDISRIVALARTITAKLNEPFPDTEVYIIVFRSILHKHVLESSQKRDLLAYIDKRSHSEANQSGGLLKYWFGTPDKIYGKNLATCWWRNKRDAVRGGGGNYHRQAMKAVQGWYQHWKVEEYQLNITKDGYTMTKIK
ncbi:uncharacterized protein PRCAT00004381001 [Priceomyces carsonii]|uniref:uncharacterized protein n=1 Tax=Priceomyces carsonii TaxID=28549 RepID=UPI002ED9DEE4|nr:unnamed protein product [Priceomyces carsonii]